MLQTNNSINSARNLLTSNINAQKSKAIVLEENLACKDMDGYIARDVSIESNGTGGVKVSPLQQRLNENLMTEIRNQSSCWRST